MPIRTNPCNPWLKNVVESGPWSDLVRANPKDRPVWRPALRLRFLDKLPHFLLLLGWARSIHPMKPLLIALLAASLAANVALLIRTRPSAVTAASPETGGPVKPGSASTSNPTAAQNHGAFSSGRGDGDTTLASLTWQPVDSEQDLHQVVARLRAAGYPPAVIRAVVNHLLTEYFASRQPTAGLPYWKQRGGPEVAASINALNQERRALFDSLLGADALPSAQLKPGERERRYGNLSDEKINALATIERDYSEINFEMWAKGRGGAGGNRAAAQSQELMEQEKLADYAAVLTPEELKQYQMRSSSSAQSLMNNLRTVDVSEAEYARLFELRKRFDDANPMRPNMDTALFAQRQVQQMALNEEAREVLGEERFYAYLAEADRQYGQVAQALSAQGPVPPATSYQVYQLQHEIQRRVNQAARNGQMSKEKTEEVRTWIEAANIRLNTLLGPEAANAYRSHGQGRIFSAFRAPPAGMTPPKG